MAIPDDGDRNATPANVETTFATAVLLAEMAFIEFRLLRGVSAILISILFAGIGAAIASRIVWIVALFLVAGLAIYSLIEAVGARRKFGELKALRAVVERGLDLYLARLESRKKAAEVRMPSDWPQESVESFDEVEAVRSLLHLAEVIRFRQRR